MKVSNMTSSRGNAIPNQFLLTGSEYYHINGEKWERKVELFQSYTTTIAKRFEACGTAILELDRDKWNYSRTTSRYRNQFTGLTTAQTKAGIKDGSIKLVDLN